MTEKPETLGGPESLFDRIWRRLIQIIPFLLLSTVIAFWAFKILSAKLGSNFFEAIALGIIVILNIASFISIVVGHIYKNRQIGVTPAFLTPLVLSMEATIQFGRPFSELLFTTFFGFALGVLVSNFSYNMLSSFVSTENIEEEDVTQIQLDSSIAEVTRLIGEMFSFLNLSKIKKNITDNEIQWMIITRDYNHYYLYAKTEDDNSVELALLGFAAGYNELTRTKINEKYQDFLKETILGYFRINNIKCKTALKADLSGDMLKIVRKGYEGMVRSVELKYTKNVLVNYIKSYKYLIVTNFYSYFGVFCEDKHF
ncbi:MAG: hypothetical protein JW878_08385 [Methanomicrobia archaeon]|nr:hypothetical protein [Methanomicrobia archaeon]